MGLSVKAEGLPLAKGQAYNPSKTATQNLSGNLSNQVNNKDQEMSGVDSSRKGFHVVTISFCFLFLELSCWKCLLFFSFNSMTYSIDTKNCCFLLSQSELVSIAYNQKVSTNTIYIMLNQKVTCVRQSYNLMPFVTSQLATSLFSVLFQPWVHS